MAGTFLICPVKLKQPITAVRHSHGPLKSSTRPTGTTAGAKADFESRALVNYSSKLLTEIRWGSCLEMAEGLPAEMRVNYACEGNKKRFEGWSWVDGVGWVQSITVNDHPQTQNTVATVHES